MAYIHLRFISRLMKMTNKRKNICLLMAQTLFLVEYMVSSYLALYYVAFTSISDVFYVKQIKL